MSIYPQFGGALDPASLEDVFDRSFPQPQASPALPIDIGSAASAPIDIGKPGPDLKRPGFFDRITDRPGGSEALLAFGASLLSEPNFFAGFGKGALAYQQVLNAERDRLKPQLTRDGGFTYRWNPATNEYDFEETAAGARALQIAQEKMSNTYDIARYRADKGYEGKIDSTKMTVGLGDRKLDHQDRWERIRADARVRAAEVAGQYGIQRAEIGAESRGNKPPPVGAMKAIGDYTTTAAKAGTVLGDVQEVLGYLRDGTLELGTLQNLRGKFAQATGVGNNEATRAYGRLQQVLQSLANAKLLDAKGVQTDGDAVRAKIEGMISSGDTRGAINELENAMEQLETTRDVALVHADEFASTYGVDTSRSSATARSKQPAARPGPAPARPRATPASRGWGKAQVER